jgi:hypothetical protein
MRRQLFAVPFALLIAILVIGGTTPTLKAQGQDRGQGLGEAKTGACNPALNFVFGAGATRFEICLSSEGNVVNQIGPAGFNHQLGYEGYRLCTPSGDYWDLGNFGQSGFLAPSVSQPNGPNTFPVTITRNTSNFQWQLVQQFSKDNTERDLQITMKLKKTNGAIGPTVYLSRWSDLDVDSSFGADVGDRSADSIYARQTRAISLTALGYGVLHTTGVGNFAYGSNDCVSASAATPIGPADLSGRVTYNLGFFNNTQTKTVKFRWGIQ